MTTLKSKFVALSTVALISASLVTQTAVACTRATFIGSDQVVITARSLDWADDSSPDLWLLPRGMQREGASGPTSAKWISKYGSVMTSFYNVASIDGMNEKGLVANVLYLAETDYGKSDGKPLVSVGVWGQYVLDHYATVAEAVEALKKEPIRITTHKLPNGAAASGHLAISDPSGDSAIFEYLDGKLHIHHGKQFTVMTNSPTYDQQLALNDYWKTVGGLEFLPGTNRASDRFVRTSFLLSSLPTVVDKNVINAVPGQTFENQALASMTSLIRGVSVPLGISVPNQPNIASTFWRSVSDQKALTYTFDSATSPNVFWVDLKKVDFADKNGPSKLPVAGGMIYAGEVSAKFKPAKLFNWLQGTPVN